MLCVFCVRSSAFSRHEWGTMANLLIILLKRMIRAFLRLFDNGAHVSSSSIRVTLSYIPYLPFTNRAVVIRHEIFPEFQNFHYLRGYSRGNRRSDLIFMGGGGMRGTICSVCSLTVMSQYKLQVYTLCLHVQV